MSGDLQLPVRKIYIDTRYKTAGSKSDTDFKFQLPYPISLPDKCVCFIDDVVIPNSWYTIDSTNNKIYARRVTLASDARTDKVITLTTNNYSVQSLRDELQEKLNDAFNSGFNVVYNPSELSFTINTDSPVYTIKFYTDEEIKNGNAHNFELDINLDTANEILGNFIPQASSSIKTSMIDLRRHHNIYISSPNIANFKTMGSRGESDIIKKIPVSSDYGSVIYDQVVANHDYIDVSKLQLNILEFKFTDVKGNVIDLRGLPVSFSMIFMIDNE